MDLNFSVNKILRCNLLTALRLSSRCLCDRGCFTNLDDQSPEVINFCILLENIFFVCLKDQRKHPWDLVCNIVSKIKKSSINSIQSMENLKNKFAKLRGWLRLSLIEKKLYEYVNFLYQNPSNLWEFYTAESAFISRDNKTVLQILIDVSELDLSFDLKGTDLNYPGVLPVDYTPYMRYIQSRDLSEATSDKVTRCSGHYAEDEENCLWKQQYAVIDKKLQSSTANKEYLEHLIGNKEKEIAELLRENASFAGQLQQSESEKANLKMNFTLLYEEFRKAVADLGGDPDSLPSPTEKFLSSQDH